jgi:putative oligomerization/nucleic acid binding protein
MIVTAEPAGDCVRITIDGRTQGLVGGKLRDNVHGLRDYMLEALPECAHQNGAQTSETGAIVSVVGEIERLAELHSKGILTDTEFADAKRKILS